MIGSSAERGLLLNGLLAAIRLSGQPMVISDPHQPDNPLVAVNPAFEALTQYTETELSGRNCRFLQGEDTDTVAVRQLANCLRRSEGCVQFLTNYRRDGSKFFNLLFVTPVHGRDGTLHFFFACQYDLSADPEAIPDEFPLGPAGLTPGQQSEFRLLLLDIAQDVAIAKGATDMTRRVRALEAALASAREVASLSTRLRSNPIRR